MFRYLPFATPVLVALTFASARAAAPETPPDHTKSAWHVQLVELHNAARAPLSVAPLTASVLLAQAAQAHANHMAASGQFAHDGIGNGDVTTRVEATGYKASRWGENIAWGPKSAAGAQQVWMNSPPHREQLLSADFKEVGFGACKAADGKVYWVAVFGSPQ